LTKTCPNYDWAKRIEGMPRELAVQFVALLPLSLMGIGALSHREMTRGADYIRNKSNLERMGYGEDQIDRITGAATADEAQTILRDEHGKRDPEAVKAAAQRVLDEVLALREQKAPASLPRLEKQGADYVVLQPDGTVITRSTDQTVAEQALVSARRETVQREMRDVHTGINEAVEFIKKVNEARQRGEDVAKVIRESAPRTLLTDYEANPTQENLDRLFETVRAFGQEINEPAELANFPVTGSNQGALAEGIWRSVIRINEGADGTIVMREFAQDNLKRAISEGRTTMDFVRQQLNDVLPQIDSSRIKRQLRTETDTDVIEAFSDVALAYFRGSIREEQIPAGLRGIMRRLAIISRDIFRRAYNLARLRAEGKLDRDFEALLAEAVGVDQQALVDRARERTEQEVGAGQNYSIGQPELFRAGASPDNYSGTAPQVDWDKVDNYGTAWNEETVKAHTNSEHDFIYPAMLDASDLRANVVELQNAQDIRKMSEKELRETYPDEFFDEKNIEDFDWRDVRDRLAQQEEQGWESLRYDEYSRPRGGGYPPLVVIRTGKNTYDMVDGNHRLDTWQEQGFDVVPAWVVDDYLFAEHTKRQEDNYSIAITPQQDTDYLAAVERGDMEMAQRMVDEAARAAGYEIETWRGDQNWWNDFKNRREVGIFTSQDKQFADEYGLARRGVTRRFYVKTNSVLDLSNPNNSAMRWIKEWGEAWQEDGWTDRATGEDITAYDAITSGRLFDYEGDWSSERWQDLQLAAKNAGFDLLIVPDAATDIEEPTATIVLQDGNIKLADPVTYDASGNAIPLSQRFDSTTADINYSIGLRPDVISQVSDRDDGSRVGTAKLGTDKVPVDTPQTSNISGDTVPQDLLAKQMAKVDYAHLPDSIRNESDPKKKRRKLINWFKKNLLALHDAFPEEVRARATHWYDGANRIAREFGQRFNATVEQASGVIAVFSPQKDWFMNVAQAMQFMELWTTSQDVVLSEETVRAEVEDIIEAATAPQRQKRKKAPDETKEQAAERKAYNQQLDQKAKDERRTTLDKIIGKTVRELDDQPYLQGWAIRVLAQVTFGRNYRNISPEGEMLGMATNDDGALAKNGWGSINEIEKAVRIMKDGALANISNNLGNEHKVRNFYNNIVAPNSGFGDATIDTHAVAAAHLMPYGAKATEVQHNFGSGMNSSDAMGVSGLYHVYLDAYREAAKERGLQPRQLQSITWEAIRLVYPAANKNAASLAKAAQTWNSLSDGRARNSLVGGTIPSPVWAGTGDVAESQSLAGATQGDGQGSDAGRSLRAGDRSDGRQGVDNYSILARYEGTPSVAVEGGRPYSPIVRDLLQRRAAGEDIPRDVIDQAINENFPAQLVEVPRSVAELPDRSTIDDAIDKGQRDKRIDVSTIEAGEKVAIRQDVPAMTRKGVGVVTVKSKAGNSYEAAVRITEPDFILNEKKSLRIAMGEAKGPHIVINGKWAADQSMPADLETWTQVGYNPDRHSFYYDRATMQQVTGGSEAYQIGNTVFVKDAQYGDGQISDISYSISTQSEIDRVQKAMDRLARSPSERISQYAALKERLAAALERNQPIMQSMRGDTLPQDFDRSRILNDLGFLDYILKVLPPEVRGRVGGYTNLAAIAPVDVYKGDQKVSEAKNPAGAIISAWMREGQNIGQAQKNTALPEGYSTVANTTDERRDKTVANFLIDRLKKIDRELERYYKRDLMERIFDVLDKSRPKAGQSGVKRSTLGPETQKFADMVYRSSLLDDEKTAERLTAIEAQITGIQPKDSSPEAFAESQKRISELSEEWTIVNTFGDLKSRPSETLAYGLEWLQGQLKAGRSAWQIKEAARIQENRERAAKVVAFLGKPTDVGRFENKSTLQRFLQAVNAYDLDHKSFEQFAPYLFGDEVAAELSKKMQRAQINEAKAELENMRSILAAIRQGAKAAGMSTGKALVAFKENQSNAVRKLEGRKVKDTKISIELAKKIVRGLADRGSLSQTDVQTLADELAALPRDTKKEFVTIKQVIFRGEEVRLTMSRAQAMQLWLTWQQRDAQEKMRADGFNDDSFDDLDNLVSGPFAQAIHRVTSRIYGSGYALTNPIYARMFGMNMPMVTNYAPARYLSSKEVKDVGLDGSPLTAGGQPSFAKSRVNHTAKLAPEDALTVLQSHIAMQSHWVAFAEVTREYRSLLSNPEVREAIRQRLGKDVLRSAEMWGDQMEQRGGNKGREIAWINNMLGAVIGGQSVSLLGYNLKSLLMQTDNFMRFFLALDSRQIGSALSDPVALMQSVRKVWKTDIIQTRLEGGATAETRFFFERFVSMFRRGAKVAEMSMMPMNYLDSAGLSVSGAVVYQAAYKDALDSGVDPTSAEQVAKDAVEAMVYRYGQPVLMGQKSNIENSGNAFTKAFFLFMSDPRLKMAIISDSVRGLATGTGDWKAHVRRIVAIEMMAVVAHVLATAFRDATSDDDDEDLWSMGGFARALLLAPLQGYFLVGSVSDLVLTRLTEAKWFTPTQNPLIRTADTAMRAFNNIDDAFNFDDPDALVKEWTNITRSIAVTPPLAAPAVIMNLVRPLVQGWERMDDDE
jgi:hypothetical protein